MALFVKKQYPLVAAVELRVAVWQEKATFWGCLFHTDLVPGFVMQRARTVTDGSTSTKHNDYDTKCFDGCIEGITPRGG